MIFQKSRLYALCNTQKAIHCINFISNMNEKVKTIWESKIPVKKKGVFRSLFGRIIPNFLMNYKAKSVKFCSLNEFLFSPQFALVEAVSRNP